MDVMTMGQEAELVKETKFSMTFLMKLRISCHLNSPDRNAAINFMQKVCLSPCREGFWVLEAVHAQVYLNFVIRSNPAPY